MQNTLVRIQEDVRARVDAISSAYPDWPCRKGCDECCRRLASEPQVTHDEWLAVDSAIDALPADTAAEVRRRIEQGAGAERPVTCPMLDRAAGACLIYEARPVACRAYGFYAERSEVLGCSRIEAVGAASENIIWGNHAALAGRLQSLGQAAPLSRWLNSRRADARRDSCR